MSKGYLKAVVIFVTSPLERSMKYRKQEWKVESIRSPVLSKGYWPIWGIYVCTYIRMYVFEEERACGWGRTEGEGERISGRPLAESGAHSSAGS